MITIQDYLRYGKQMLLPEIGESGQLKLKKAKVLVIGAGGLGCPILQYLATSGVGTIGIVDFDKVELHNLHRQVLYTEKHVDTPKAITAQTILEALNPTIEIQAFEEKLTVENAERIFSAFDVIVDGCDNFTTRYLVNDTCVKLGKPLVYGSILKFEGQMAVFNHNGSKNLRDLFPEPPNPEDVPSCSINGVLGSLPGIIGTMMAHETLKLIMELPTLKNELVLFNTLEWNYTKLKF
ncbi:thiF protein [Flavobacterium saliperosum S13]|uniref:Molybdopterin-synthase adenylyltransferase n=2 Tax=Flavobacterium saliperosum TaxID=329186 RepID=A0A1G4V812_9FLAO|nr:HesA/MoeB/ThiF family protein [Flavobacterium saliperosum]ESU28039.1 thiF protein [Flavobacterium saliperosum S13]SCX02737.1 adenylyltransferase and sulfurtransferase [Flavobacterium saliperosum]